MKKFLYVFLTVLVCLLFNTSCSNGEKMENKIESSVDKGNKLNLYGRNLYNEEYNADEFINVMSGFEVKFTGTSLTAEMKSSPKPQGPYDAPRFTVWSIFIDGAKDPFTLQLDVKNKEWETYTIVSELLEGEHTVKVLKTDDPLISSCFVRNYQTDGTFSKAPQKPSLKIECYGDSITSGGDNIPLEDGEMYLGTDPKHCNGGATYMAYATYDLNAELNVFAQIGIPLTGTGGVANIYARISPQRSTKWHLKNFIPDIVVVGLGTNDRRIDSRMSSYVNTCKRFIENLSVEYGDTNKEIQYICVHGFMDDGTDIIGEKIQEVVDALSLKGFKICRLQFEEASIRGGPGKLDLADQSTYWNGHPLWQEHKKASNLLTQLIHELGY